MSGKAAHIELTTRMYEILTQLTESRNASQAIIVRARIILLGFDQLKNQEIATAVDRCAKTIGIWRRRWRDSFQALLQMQFDLNQSAFRRAIIDTLSDAPRSGSPGRFTDEQLTGLIALACKDPQNSGRPVTSWTGAELADEAQRRQLVDAISASHVNRVLREVNLKPHRSRYWCNTTEQDPEKFQREVETVCRTYREAQQLADEQQTHTVCIDEMTSLQANERRAETKRARPGQPAREEFQYTRHGTVCVTANWH
ncbi:MAG: helix-turn-helix domain-containing protein, partial [Woeseia sp.]